MIVTVMLCRAEYDPKSDLLDCEFMLKGKWFQRKDVGVWFWSFKELDCLFPL